MKSKLYHTPAYVAMYRVTSQELMQRGPSVTTVQKRELLAAIPQQLG